MIYLRPVESGDLDALERLAVLAGTGMTNLPAERDVLAHKIELSLASFADQRSDAGAGPDTFFLLAAVDDERDAVVGCTGVIGAVGLDRPFYSFKLTNLPHTSQELDRYDNYAVLQMVNEYRGAAEIGTLYLEPDARRDRNGRLLSRGRFLFMAEHRARFSELVMAELRGVLDERGHSVFWNGLGRHFFDMDFSKADYLSALGKFQFIADLMPKHPIYLCLLAPAVQAVVGVAHEASRPALAMLEREGFRFEGCVDVFDAGPTVHCPIDELRTVRESVVGEVEDVREVDDASPVYMVARRSLADYRVARGPVRRGAGGAITIGPALAAALELEPGDPVRFAPF